MKELFHPIGTVPEDGEPKLTIRIIGRCGFRCPACSTFSGPERPGVLSLADFRKIIGFLAKDNFHGVLNISGGETTLHPDLPKILSWSSRRLPLAKIAVFTNGDWVGRRGWRSRLKTLLRHPNVLVRFSLDKEHAEGKAKADFGPAWEGQVRAVEQARLDKARLFLEACRREGAQPGLNYDFAFKGTIAEGKAYAASLGDVPIYPLFFQRDPQNRPRQMGFLAVDLDRRGRPVVYLTLGHLSREEALGGPETLPLALKQNRESLQGLA